MLGLEENKFSVMEIKKLFDCRMRLIAFIVFGFTKIISNGIATIARSLLALDRYLMEII